MWYSLYEELATAMEAKNSRKLHQLFKYLQKFRVVFVISLQCVVSVLKGIRLNSQYKYFTYLAYGLLYINFLVFIFEFSYYGFSVYFYIVKKETINAESQELFFKNTPNLRRSLRPIDQINNSSNQMLEYDLASCKTFKNEISDLDFLLDESKVDSY